MKAWITGASSGIGAALALQYASAGNQLVLTGRSKERLSNVQASVRSRGGEAAIFSLDLSDRLATARGVADVCDQYGPFDLVVSCAGVSQRALATDAVPDVVARIIDTNLFATVVVSNAVVAGMIARRSGTIGIVTSIAAALPAPRRTVYNATKAAQTQFARTLRNEVSGFGVHVCEIVPGFVRTEISHNALTGAGDPHGVLDQNQATGIRADSAAKAIAKGIARHKRRIVVGVPPAARVAMRLVPIVPGAIDRVLRSRSD